MVCLKVWEKRVRGEGEERGGEGRRMDISPICLDVVGGIGEPYDRINL